MKAAVVIVAACLLSATTAGATVRLVTSQQIKNGTIQPVDLSAKTRTLTESTLTALVEPGQWKVLTPACPAGQSAVSGGFSFDGHVTSSNSIETGWLVFAVNDTTSLKALKAYAYCLPVLWKTP